MTRLFEHWLLLPQRLALHEPSATAVLADVHLGYSAARQRLGDAVPGRTVAEELQPLAAAARQHDIRAVIVAGDLFERGYDATLAQDFLDVLDRLNIRMLGLVPGNHDRSIDQAANQLPLFPDGIDLAGWRIVHGDQPVEQAKGRDGPLASRHPLATAQGPVLPDARPSGRFCPAFSLDAAGVNVPAIRGWRVMGLLCGVWDEGGFGEMTAIRKLAIPSQGCIALS